MTDTLSAEELDGILGAIFMSNDARQDPYPGYATVRETTALQPSQIVMDDTPLHVHMARILETLRQQTRATLTELFTPPHTRGRLLGLFLATLELIKGRQAQADQPEPFGEVWLEAVSSEQ